MLTRHGSYLHPTIKITQPQSTRTETELLLIIFRVNFIYQSFFTILETVSQYCPCLMQKTLLLNDTCICMYHVCHGIHVEVKDNVQQLVISLFHVGPEEQGTNASPRLWHKRLSHWLSACLPALRPLSLTSNHTRLRAFTKLCLSFLYFCSTLAPSVFSPSEPFGITCSSLDATSLCFQEF